MLLLVCFPPLPVLSLPVWVTKHWTLVGFGAYVSYRMCSNVLPLPLLRRPLRACSAVSSSMSIKSKLYSEDDDDDDKGVLPVLLIHCTQTHRQTDKHTDTNWQTETGDAFNDEMIGTWWHTKVVIRKLKQLSKRLEMLVFTGKFLTYCVLSSTQPPTLNRVKKWAVTYKLQGDGLVCPTGAVVCLLGAGCTACPTVC